MGGCSANATWLPRFEDQRNAKNWPAFATVKSGELRFWMHAEMSGGTSCRIQLCTVSPNGEGVPNKPASILTFYDLSKVLFSDVIWFNPYRSLRFEICRFGDLPGFCTARPLLRFGTSQKNWWFGTWNLENFWRSWVNFRVDTWHPMTLWMNFGWLAHGNHISFIYIPWPFLTQECGNCERQFLRN